MLTRLVVLASRSTELMLVKFTATFTVLIVTQVRYNSFYTTTFLDTATPIFLPQSLRANTSLLATNEPAAFLGEPSLHSPLFMRKFLLPVVKVVEKLVLSGKLHIGGRLVLDCTDASSCCRKKYSLVIVLILRFVVKLAVVRRDAPSSCLLRL